MAEGEKGRKTGDGTAALLGYLRGLIRLAVFQADGEGDLRFWLKLAWVIRYVTGITK